VDSSPWLMAHVAQRRCAIFKGRRGASPALVVNREIDGLTFFASELLVYRRIVLSHDWGDKFNRAQEISVKKSERSYRAQLTVSSDEPLMCRAPLPTLDSPPWLPPSLPHLCPHRLQFVRVLGAV
jgi:hypothetical protein